MARHTKLGCCSRYVPDVETTIAFYERAFGMERKMIVEGGGYGELLGPPPLGFASEAQAESLVGSFAKQRPGAPPAACELGFVVDDVAAAFDRAIAAGAVAVAKPAKKPWGQIVAYVRDCDGALVEICTSWD
jgi:uncharacterized glyoxalase superfamily protein PhnB